MKTAGGPDFLHEVAAAARVRQQVLDHVRLGVLLSFEGVARTPVLVAERAVGPLGPRGFVEMDESERVPIFHEPAGRPPGILYRGWPVVGKEVAKQIALTLGAAQESSLRVASRRLCLANGTRADPIDRLIDSSVGYESMFGGQRENAKYRSVAKAISIAIAEVIGSGSLAPPANTAQLIREISTLRNHYVHGEQDSNHDDLETISRVASQIGLMAFSPIIKDPELLHAKSAFERRKIASNRHGFDVDSGKLIRS